MLHPCRIRTAPVRDLLRPKSFANRLPLRRCYAQPADVAQIFQEKRAWDAFPDDVQRIAVYAEHARSHNYQIPLISKASPGLDLPKAYHVAAAVRALRESNGEVVVGRKIGLTNQKNWSQSGINAPIWNYTYNSTVVDLPEPNALAAGQTVTANLHHLSSMQPKIEPEIVFKLSQTPEPTMNEAEVLSCIEWMAHGFEIIATIFPNWKNTPADCVAAFGFHGMLLVGPKTSTPSLSGLLEQLASFQLELNRNGRLVENGGGSNVLGSPIASLRQLTEVLTKDEHNSPVQAGDIITTGTLTNPHLIQDGDVWSTKLDGIDLPGLNVKFQLSQRAGL